MSNCSFNQTRQLDYGLNVDGVLGIRTQGTRDKGWKAQTNPLSYGGPLLNFHLTEFAFLSMSSVTR